MLEDINIETRMINSPDNIDRDIDKLILPGVGSFDYAMELLESKSFVEPIKKFTSLESNKLLGICVGMQILASESEEGKKEGLNLIPGKVKKFKEAKVLPHVGWNTVKKNGENRLLDNDQDLFEFYFLHSYYFEPKEKKFQIGLTNYFKPFASIINNNNIYGIQFHPEKSHSNGIKLLSNFNKL